jgi:hypothetical protein
MLSSTLGDRLPVSPGVRVRLLLHDTPDPKEVECAVREADLP